MLLNLVSLPPLAAATLTGLDWAMIATYFTLLLGVAWYVVSKNKNTAQDYFLAGRNLSWWIVGASIFASNIGSEHIVGLAGSGAKDGVAMAHYELHAWCLLMLGWVFVPFYMRSQVFTMPEFLERRFCIKSRYILSIVSLVTFVLSKIAVGIYAGGVVFSTLLPDVNLMILGHNVDSFWIGSIAVILLTGLYTCVGGMRAVAYNDAVQAVVLIIGSFCLTAYGLYTLGHGHFLDGWTKMRELCGSDMLNLWKPLVPPGVESTWSPVEVVQAGKVVKQAWYFNSHYPWLGMAICAPVIGLWYWCTDQYIVQRALGAPNETGARRGSLFAAFLKLFPVYLFIIPGLIGFALVKSNAIPELTKSFDAQNTFPLMVKHMLPSGLRGIVVAGLLSALMGSLAGVFNACSTLFTVDIYEKWKPKASQAQIVRTGQIATIVMVVIALLWIPVVKGADGLYGYLQAVQGYLAPPVFVVFFFGVFFKRLNAAGSLWAMVAGFALGLFRMAVDTPVTLGRITGYSEGSFLWIVNKINFQYFSIIITIVSAITMVVVSLLTKAPDYKTIGGLTFGTASTDESTATRESWDWRDVAASAFVCFCIVGAYLYFRG